MNSDREKDRFQNTRNSRPNKAKDDHNSIEDNPSIKDDSSRKDDNDNELIHRIRGGGDNQITKKAKGEAMSNSWLLNFNKPLRVVGYGCHYASV